MTQPNQFLDGVFSEATSLTHLLDTNDNEPIFFFFYELILKCMLFVSALNVYNY